MHSECRSLSGGGGRVVIAVEMLGMAYLPKATSALTILELS